LKHFSGFGNISALIEGIKVDIAAFTNLNKFAMVTDKKWVKV
jgi:hypothetical protein